MIPNAADTMLKFGNISPPSDEDDLSNKNASSGSGGGPFGASPTKGIFSVSFQDLNADFVMPSTFKTIKKLGKGAYGKVMEVMHVAT